MALGPSYKLPKMKYSIYQMYTFGKLKITWLWVLVTNYQKYMVFYPSYNLPKINKEQR